MGSIPATDEEKFRCPNILFLVSFARMTRNKCAILRIGTLTWDLCRESHPLCRLKNPTVVYMITCMLSSCKTGVHNVHLLIIFERGCSSNGRKKVWSAIEVTVKFERHPNFRISHNLARTLDCFLCKVPDLLWY